MTDAVIAGHICIDIIPSFDDDAPGDLSVLVAPGRLTEVGPAALSTGGAVSNTGLNMVKLGIDAALMGKVGEDLFGQAILDVVRRYGADLADGMIVTPDAVSAYTLVINPPGTDRAFLHCSGANATFSAADVRYELLDGARLFHFGYPPIMRRMYLNGGEQLAELFRRAQATGVTTSLDMSMPDPNAESGRVDWRAVLERTLPYVNIFVPSVEELLFMLARARFDELEAQGGVLAGLTPADLERLVDAVWAMGSPIVMLKLGDRGAYLRTPGALHDFGRAAPPDLDAWRSRELWAPCFVPQKLVGTTGAGDATIAGFLTAVLRGMGPEDALTMATAVGVCNVEAANALDGVRTWEATLARVQAGWARQPVANLEADTPPGWHWDEARGLWRGPYDLG
ncbi:MAG: sugar kinase [Anaerolineae bacterium]